MSSWLVFHSAQKDQYQVWRRRGPQIGKAALLSYASGRTFFFLTAKSEEEMWTSVGHQGVNLCPSLVFPGHLPVLGIVAVGSGLALIIFGISSFLIYRWVCPWALFIFFIFFWWWCWCCCCANSTNGIVAFWGKTLLKVDLWVWPVDGRRRGFLRNSCPSRRWR